MDRRKFIATSGTGIGLGIAGCLDVTVGDESDSSEGPGDGNSSNQDSSDGDDSPSSNESGDGGGDETNDDSGDDANDDGTEGNETDDEPEGDGDETDDDTDEQPDSGDLTVEFESCARAVVSGTFEDGDVAYASTGFYDDAGFGNTLLEDGVTFGDDVDAPFTGTVVFEVGSGSSVDAGDDEIVVEIPDYGNGTVITGLTTDQKDYFVVSLTHENPHAEDCLDEQAPDDEDREHGDGTDGNDGGDGGNGGDEGGDGGNGGDEGGDGGNGGEAGDENGDDGNDGGPPAFDVSITGTNAPVDAGDFVEVSGELENTGGSGTETVRLVVGHSSETVESRSVTLEAGERTSITEGYQTPPVAADQEIPVRIETESDSAEETVLVRGN